MRCLNKNKQTIYYALYQGQEPVTHEDEYGNILHTGEYLQSYTKPKSLSVSVSPARGSASNEMFGGLEGYDRVIVTDDAKCPIDEYSRLWVDAPVSAPHDYIVKQVAKSLNSVAYAIAKVIVGA